MSDDRSQRRLADADLLIRLGGASVDADGRLTIVRALELRAATLRRDGRRAEAADEFARIAEQFDGAPEEELRRHVARAVVQRARLLQELGDAAAAARVLEAGEPTVGDLLWPSERRSAQALEDAATHVADKDVTRALERYLDAIGAHEPADAPAVAIEAAGQHAMTATWAGHDPDGGLGTCDSWLADADDAWEGERRAAFGWLHGARAWILWTAGRHRLVVPALDAGLAYLGDDDAHPRVVEVRGWLLDELARLEERRSSPPPRPPRRAGRDVPAPVLPRMSPQNEARLLARRWTRDPTVAARRARLDAILGSSATLDDEELHLLVFCAYRKALKVTRRTDRLVLRRRLVDAGRDPAPSAPLRDLLDRLGVAVGDGPALADVLLPPATDWSAPSQADTGGAAGGGAGS